MILFLILRRFDLISILLIEVINFNEVCSRSVVILYLGVTNAIRKRYNSQVYEKSEFEF